MELQITDTELLEKSYQWIRRLILTGGKDWKLSVPVRPDDPDIVLANLLRRFKKYSDALDQLNTLEKVVNLSDSEIVRVVNEGKGK